MAMDRRLIPVVMTLCLLTLGACSRDAANELPAGAAPAELDFAVTGTTAQTGDTIRAVLRNGSGERLGYNLCFSVLERREAGGWQTVQRMPDGTICTADLRILEPGESASLDQEIHGFLEPGVYRFRTDVEWPLGAARTSLASNGFRIN